MTAATATATEPTPTRRRPWAPPPGGRPIAFYPVVLAAIVVVELFVSSGVSPLEMLRSLAALIVVGFALTVLGRVVLGDAHRAGIFAAFALLLVVAGADLRLAAVVAAAIGLLFVERYAVPAERRT